MTAPAPLALGLVGCGRLAELGYAPAAAIASGVRIVAVADPAEARREAVAALTGAAAFADTATMLDAARVDAVVLATPAAAHQQDASLAAARGVAVLVEKPPAPDAEGAAALARLRPAPYVGFNRRFDPGVRAVRDRAAHLGEVRLRLAIGYRRRAWGAVTVHDDALTDLGPHVIDLARWITASDVLAVSRADVGVDRARFELVLARGHAVVDVATDRVHHEVVEARSAGGRRILARHELGGLRAGLLDRVRRSAAPSALVVSLAGELDAFAAAVRGETTELGTARDGWAVMETIDAVRASAAGNGRPAAVRSIPD